MHSWFLCWTVCRMECGSLVSTRWLCANRTAKGASMVLNRWADTSCRLLRKIALSIMGVTGRICYPLIQFVTITISSSTVVKVHSPSSATASQHTVGKSLPRRLTPRARRKSWLVLKVPLPRTLKDNVYLYSTASYLSS